MRWTTGTLYSLLVLAALVLNGCSSHAPPPSGKLSDSIAVVAQLNDQLSQWRGAPYRYGGLQPSGVDCSGFVFRTFRDRFGMVLPRTTTAQTEIGTKSPEMNSCPAI